MACSFCHCCSSPPNNPSSFHLLFFFFFLVVSLSLFFPCDGQSTLSRGQFLRDGETLVSSGGIFEFGFFSPPNSTLRYVGIWYHNISVQTVIWVANRDNPLSDKNGSFSIASNGSLVILDGSNSTVWSTISNSSAVNATATLSDDGDLVLYPSADTSDSTAAFWQSFDHPTDNFLPSMRLKANSADGENRAFTSWKSDTDPTPGNFSLGVDPRASPQMVVWDIGSDRRLWRSGHWDGLIFMGVPNMTASILHGFRLSNADSEGNMYFTYTPRNSSDLLRFWIGPDGLEEELRWNPEGNEWDVTELQPANPCEEYNKCGDFAICDINKSSKCECMDGFVPENVEEWRVGNWSGGCVRRSGLQCGTNSSSQDGFLEMDYVKLPDFADLGSGTSDNECRETCLANCSCYAFSYVSTVGCMVWSGNLIDVERFESGGRSLFVRVAASELASRKISTAVIVVVVVIGIFLLGVSLWLLWRFKEDLKAYLISCCRSRKKDSPLFDISRSTTEPSSELSGQCGDVNGYPKQMKGSDFRLFNFSAIATATDNFSDQNKLGRGGFGPVYKGKLSGGEEIAVKRLSRKSGQGLEEFKNELVLIAKLQHRNLVRLLGYCIKGEEKMLVYEYMPNRSLDRFLFDESKKSILDWRKRFQIIEGIARGLLYLHRDSRLRIVHRDLKASNILLDEEMNPKISDFGMARIFGGNQYEANTTRVVGTYGYMAPEYAMGGLFSTKSDVYSFGVLLLEIVSGRRNIGFQSSEHSNLIGHAWHQWNEGDVMELVDPAISSSTPKNEVLRCIHLGMLCVQDSAAQRPTMSSVIMLLESEAATLRNPRQPTFTYVRRSEETDAGHDFEINDIDVSCNDVTVTRIVGR